MTEPSDPTPPPDPARRRAHRRYGAYDRSTRPVPPPRGLSRRWLLIVAIAVAAVLVIGGGSLTALLLRDANRNGPADPTVAIDSFLRAVYHDHDAAEATALVCAEARDEGALTAKINSIAEYAEAYPQPRFRWSQPRQVDETDELAIMDVTVTMVTSQEQLAQHTLRISLLDTADNGWWVCNIEGADDAPTGDDDQGESDDNE